MLQIANSFDPETKRKIKKSFWLGLISGISAGALAYVATRDLKASVYAAVGAFAGFAKNTVDEFKAGE